ncbi:hypothetical protein PAPYR_6221 [Paratrimastix pyriformis]|uniref:Uncharacterized protein n=1 Tax=Paratrimastix pyriformis TaxID=342808 RepID=A0ABQ8UH43_9EUKA|nr:hypothetical protein PAPYR_6221 [Paratrimastix pyriformis]
MTLRGRLTQPDLLARLRTTGSLSSACPQLQKLTMRCSLPAAGLLGVFRDRSCQLKFALVKLLLSPGVLSLRTKGEANLREQQHFHMLAEDIQMSSMSADQLYREIKAGIKLHKREFLEVRESSPYYARLNVYTGGPNRRTLDDITADFIHLYDDAAATKLVEPVPKPAGEQDLASRAKQLVDKIRGGQMPSKCEYRIFLHHPAFASLSLMTGGWQQRTLEDISTDFQSLYDQYSYQQALDRIKEESFSPDKPMRKLKQLSSTSTYKASNLNEKKISRQHSIGLSAAQLARPCFTIVIDDFKLSYVQGIAPFLRDHPNVTVLLPTTVPGEMAKALQHKDLQGVAKQVLILPGLWKDVVQKLLAIQAQTPFVLAGAWYDSCSTLGGNKKDGIFPKEDLRATVPLLAPDAILGVTLCKRREGGNVYGHTIAYMKELQKEFNRPLHREPLKDQEYYSMFVLWYKCG